MEATMPILSNAHPFESVASWPVKNRLTDEEFDAFLADLATCKVLRVCGSYAAGLENSRGYLSDLDFYVMPDHPASDDRNIQQVINLFKKHQVDMGSCFIGCIGTPRNNVYAPFPVEMSSHFDTPRKKVIEIEIRGIKFKAYKQGRG